MDTVSDFVKYRAAEKLARKRSPNPTPTDIFKAVGEVNRMLEILLAIHDAIEEEETNGTQEDRHA